MQLPFKFLSVTMKKIFSQDKVTNCLSSNLQAFNYVTTPQQRSEKSGAAAARNIVRGVDKIRPRNAHIS